MGKSKSSPCKKCDKNKCDCKCKSKLYCLAKKINAKLKPNFLLTSKDINPNGKVITEPGVYQLAEDVTFAPTRNAIIQTPVTFSGGGNPTSQATGLALVSGGIVRGIDIVTPGSGYTSMPIVTIGGTGTLATASPAQFGGIVSLTLDAPSFGGAGYSSLPTLTFSPSGNGAIILPIIDTTSGKVVDFQVLDPGSGFGTTATTVTITGGGATTNATAQVNIGSGVTRALVTNGGSGYVDTVVAAITIMSSNVTLLLGDHVLKQEGIDNSGNVSPSQNIFVAGIVVPDIIPNLTRGMVESIIVSTIGSGYTSTPNVVISAPSSGTDNAVASAIVNNGVVTAFQVTNPGSGYTTNPTITVSGGGGLTQATGLPNIYLTDAVGLENITISGDKGVIDGFSFRGVQIFGHTNNIEVSNVTIEHCGKLAAQATLPYPGYTSNFQISGGDTIVKSSTVGLGIGETGTGSGGFVGYFGPFFFTKRPGAQNKVSNVILDNVSCLGNHTLGHFISNTTNIEVTNCHTDDTFNDNYYAVFSGWFGSNDPSEFPSVKNLIVRDSTYNRTQLIGNYKNQAFNNCVGLSPLYVSGFIFDNCESNDTENTTAAFAVTAGTACSGIQDGVFQGCQFRNSSGMGTVDGFHSSGSGGAFNIGHSGFDVELRDCAASNIINIGNMRIPTPIVNTGTDKSTGFDLYYTKNFYLENCVASNIQYNAIFFPGKGLPRNGAQGFSLLPSFIPQANIQSVKYVNCHSSSCVSSNGGSSNGFFIGNNASPPNQGVQSILYEDCTADNNLSAIPAITTPIGGTGAGALGLIPQGVGLGFGLFQDRTLSGGVQLETINIFPVVYNNCKSHNNQGAPTNNPLPLFAVTSTLYSAGFYAQSLPDATVPLLGVSYYQCESIGDVYGFLLRNTRLCSIRNCRADNNVVQAGVTNNIAIDGIVGEGFTDLGLGVTNTPGSVIPGTTNSTFENNKAYHNGSATTFFGPNSNYNAFVAAGITVPLFEVQVSSPLTSYIYINPSPSTSLGGFNTNPNVYNISTIP
ncbi:MAG: hypothetical protein Sylvanvirus8_17 [Sylvanvirus sp.]|uniref:Uncharacterized protein n=1 Tax=Sylvanvirus sp. TaxID=2487774 RepID=A0A3G5AJP9_9VIRU|nr:MAG: hypothetical protein Sylvanvirus8_17 [Sylvanvirus sp.]